MKQCLNYLLQRFKAQNPWQIHVNLMDGCRTRFHKYLCIPASFCPSYKMFLWWQFYWAENARFLTLRSQELCFPFVYCPFLFCLLIIMLSIISIFSKFSHILLCPVQGHAWAGCAVANMRPTHLRLIPEGEVMSCRDHPFGDLCLVSVDIKGLFVLGQLHRCHQQYINEAAFLSNVFLFSFPTFPLEPLYWKSMAIFMFCFFKLCCHSPKLARERKLTKALRGIWQAKKPNSHAVFCFLNLTGNSVAEVWVTWQL